MLVASLIRMTVAICRRRAQGTHSNFTSEALPLQAFAPVDLGPRDNFHLEIFAGSGFQKLDDVLDFFRRQFLAATEFDDERIKIDLPDPKLAELHNLQKVRPAYVEGMQCPVATFESICRPAVQLMECRTAMAAGTGVLQD